MAFWHLLAYVFIFLSCLICGNIKYAISPHHHHHDLKWCSIQRCCTYRNIIHTRVMCDVMLNDVKQINNRKQNNFCTTAWSGVCHHAPETAMLHLLMNHCLHISNFTVTQSMLWNVPEMSECCYHLCYS